MKKIAKYIYSKLKTSPIYVDIDPKIIKIRKNYFGDNPNDVDCETSDHVIDPFYRVRHSV